MELVQLFFSIRKLQSSTQQTVFYSRPFKSFPAEIKSYINEENNNYEYTIMCPPTAIIIIIITIDVTTGL